MLDFDLGDELSLLVDTARGFADEALTPRLRGAEAARRVDAAVRETYAQIGLAGLELPEALGGAGLGSLARVLVGEELAAGDVGVALALDPLGPALAPIAELGGDEALRALALPLLEREGARAWTVLAEDAALDVDAERMRGRVAWVPADRVDLLVVLGRDGALVAREGIEVRPLRGAGLRAAGASELRLDAPVVARWTAAPAAGRARARVRLYAASLLLGVLRATCEFSRAYAQEREAFGRPIGHHQALAFLITDMRMALDGARLLVHEAAARLDAGLPPEVEAASAFAQCIEAARSIGPDGVQILGGHGFMADYPVEKHMREARALSLLFGGYDTAVEEAGRALCGRAHPLALDAAAVEGA